MEGALEAPLRMAFRHCCSRSRSHSHSRQLLNHIVDCLATRKPETLYAEFPIPSASHETGHLRLTYGRFANAVNRIAWWLYNTIGQGKNFETLAYFGPNDLTYPCLILGAVKAGYKILLLSPHNSVDDQLNLLKTTDCRTLLVPKSSEPTSKPVFAVLDEGLSILEVPTVDELLQPRCPAFQYTKTFEEARWDPLVVLHTLGSNGPPKPIIWVQGFVSSYAKQQQLDPPTGYENVDHHYMGNRVMVAYPPFDATYVTHVLVNAICNQTVPIVPLEAAISSANPLLDTLKTTNVDIVFLVPGVIEQLSQSPDLLAEISWRIPLIAYCGGEVSQRKGDIVSKKIPLINIYGTTEGANIGTIREEDDTTRNEWRYIMFHADSGAEFHHYVDDIHELFLVQRSDLEYQHQVFTTFRDVQEYSTKDLFVQHPSNPNFWRYVGRVDDSIVLLNGEKINPVSIEQNILSRCNEISGVLVAGLERFQPSLLVDMIGRQRVTAFNKAEDIGVIWRFIDEVNRSLPAYARIARSHVILTDPNRPLLRSSRGTILRAAALAEYAKEIDALYTGTKGVSVNGKSTSLVTHRGTSALIDYVTKSVLKVTKRSFNDDENFFAGGMDSLQVLLLVRDLRTSLEIPGIAMGAIYRNPSISSLASNIQQIAAGREIDTSDHKGLRRGRINTLLREYKLLVDAIIPSTGVDEPNGNGNTSTSQKVVLLTASTGALGSYLLERLLATSDIVHIYCSYAADGGHKAQGGGQILTDGFPTDRVTFLPVDYTKPDFGLEREAYSSLQKQVNYIIHNAWPINLNIPLSSFLPCLQGLVNLISFAASSHYHPSLLFISSTTAVSTLGGSKIPEELIYDSTVPTATGYGESKYIAERILHYSARKLSVKSHIARVGQIAGPIHGKGEWDKDEWLPSLVRSSRYIGAVPESLGPCLDSVDWIPVDALAEILIDVIGSTELENGIDSGAVVYNILNPHPVKWGTLLPTISQGFLSAETISTVPLQSWIVQVKEDTDKIDAAKDNELGALLKSNPALKLVRFYEDASRQEGIGWAMENAMNASQALRDLEGIKRVWMKKWMKGWLA